MVGNALSVRTAANLSMKYKTINFVAFQIGWFACVLGGANSMPWLGPLVFLPIIAWHLYQADRPQQEIKLMLTALLIGVLFDQSLLSAGWLQYPAGPWPSNLLPVWMMALWPLFASTLNLSMHWLSGRMVVASLLGLIGGPLAYLAGMELGAMQFLQPEKLTVALAIGWAVIMPLLLLLSTRFNGFKPDMARE